MAASYPFHLAETCLAADVGKGATRKFFGISDCFAKVTRLPTGLYRGFVVEFVGTSLFSSLCLASYPFETVSRRMMLDSHQPWSSAEKPKNGGWKVAKAIYKNEGLCGFYKRTGCLLPSLCLIFNCGRLCSDGEAR
ncbi:hypothetical protein L596_030022 [Steinernema carpocapsae]|uniref:ADP/ATP translocase n=1 Tax=Steinernema carpocapsae TaxID=34508 RepID=A0A4U5LRH6_STECR|nr:hypothetical protein L596_030022 [Steinernema carpocapsae]